MTASAAEQCLQFRGLVRKMLCRHPQQAKKAGWGKLDHYCLKMTVQLIIVLAGKLSDQATAVVLIKLLTYKILHHIGCAQIQGNL